MICCHVILLESRRDSCHLLDASTSLQDSKRSQQPLHPISINLYMSRIPVPNGSLHHTTSSSNSFESTSASNMSASPATDTRRKQSKRDEVGCFSFPPCYPCVHFTFYCMCRPLRKGSLYGCLERPSLHPLSEHNIVNLFLVTVQLGI